MKRPLVYITAASSQAPYRSPRRERQGSFAPLLLLSPHNLQLCGGPKYCESRRENEENAARYCRQVYDAGYSPICPMLVLSTFLKDSIPQEHKDGLNMARDYLRRPHVLVVCGNSVSEAMKNDIAVAERLHITAASSQAPYRSPRRKRQGSFTPLLLLSPHNLRLCGGPFVDGILTVKGQGRKSCR